MSTIPQNSRYMVDFIRASDSPADIKFVQVWAKVLGEDLEQLTHEPFALSIGERHSGNSECTWIARIYTVDTETKEPNLDLQTESILHVHGQQRYFARHHEHAEMNYSGVVETHVFVSTLRSQLPLQRAKTLAKVLMRLAFSHYATRIAADFADWSTDYLDAPSYKTYTLDKGEQAMSFEGLWPEVKKVNVGMSDWIGNCPMSEWDVIDFIRSKSPWPTGVVIIGGNDELTAKVTDELYSRTGTVLRTKHEVSNQTDLISSIADDTYIASGCEYNHYAFVRLVRGASSSHELRHQTIQRLRDVGAKSVILIWVKGNPERDNLNAQSVDDTLRNDPPSIDDCDAFFTLRS